MSTRLLKMVHLEVEPGVFKTLYFDWEHETLRPGVVFIRNDGSVVFEINESGLKGDPIDKARKLVVVWGDSVVFGVGAQPKPAHELKPLSCSALNAACSGCDFTRRACATRFHGHTNGNGAAGCVTTLVNIRQSSMRHPGAGGPL